MKKVVEEEDARHVEAMHYAATAGIRVGKENLKTIKPNAGFWPTVLEYEKKGKIVSEDLKLANRNKSWILADSPRIREERKD